MSERNPSTEEFVLPKSVLYVKREADDLLYDLTVDGRYPYVVGLPETGKSSLVMQTALRLRSASVQTSVVDVADVARIAGSGEASPFYRSIARQIHRDLGLEFDLEAWWQERAMYYRLFVLNQFFREVCIRARSAVAVFLDGIDFIPGQLASDLLPLIRSFFNDRVADAAFKKLTFVLTGVAAPSDLTSAQQTPYNIGTRIDLSDFTPEEAHQLGRRLNVQQMVRAMYWTCGHPYFTQVVCAGATEGADVVLYEPGKLSLAANPRAVHDLFCSYGWTGGNMLVVNGLEGMAAVWRTRLRGTTPGQQYMVRLAGASAYPANPALLRIRVNGVAGPAVQLPGYGGVCPSANAAPSTVWVPMEMQFAATTEDAEIEVVAEGISPRGSDFTISHIEVQ